jgi:hypothetical protein
MQRRWLSAGHDSSKPLPRTPWPRVVPAPSRSAAGVHEVISMKSAACRLLCFMILFASAACEDCPNRKVPIDVQPNRMPRGTIQELKVRFPSTVFIGGPVDREKDARINIRMPGGAVVGAWRGDESDSSSGIVIRVWIVDPKTLALRLRLERSMQPGPYEVMVISDLAGACLGTWGTSTLTVT